MVNKETLTLLKAFKDPLIKLATYAKDEIAHFIDDGLADYIDNLRGKYMFTKTFLFRSENVNFYNVFFPVSLCLGTSKRKIQTLSELFSSSRFVTLIGNAGSGKTMLMKHFFLSSIQSQFRIPIVIELRNLNYFDGSIIDYIYQMIFHNKLSPNQNILERILDSGNFIFLLDGYDEIYSERKHKITADLERFVDKYSKNNFIISSRPFSGIESIDRFNNYYVQELNEQEIHEFIDLQLKESEETQLAVKIKSVIDLPENRDYRSFLSNPLLLSMFILTFKTYPELPKKKSKFYWNVFDTLAIKHDSFTKKGGYQHERKAGLQNEEYEKILKWFSYISLFEGMYSFDSQYLTSKLNEIKKAMNFDVSTQYLIEDLILSISILVVDGIEYKFPHKSLQEYFCALLIKDLAEDQKAKIYSEKFELQAKLSLGGNDNFWNLCLEIDKPSFIKHFLIIQLEKICHEFRSKEPLHLIKHLYDSLKYREDYICLGNEIRITKTRISSNFTTNLLDFFNISITFILSLHAYCSDDSELKNFLKTNYTGSISPIERSSEYYIVYSKAWSPELETILKKVGIVNEVATLDKKLNKIIQGLREELAQENLRENNLLNLV